MIQDYLELFELRCDPGTTAEESQLVLAKKKGNYTIRPTTNTRGKCKVIIHHHTGTLQGQNIAHWETHIYKAYMEKAWKRPEDRHEITKDECYKEAREKVELHRQKQAQEEQRKKEKQEAQYGQKTTGGQRENEHERHRGRQQPGQRDEQRRKQERQQPQGMTTRLKQRQQRQHLEGEGRQDEVQKNQRLRGNQQEQKPRGEKAQEQRNREESQ
jgi:hypothetical protein